MRDIGGRRIGTVRRRQLHEVVALVAEARRTTVDSSVVHVTWGRMTGGVHDAVVFLVATDHARARRSLPSEIRVVLDGRELVAPTDVRVIARGHKHAGAVRTGFHCGVAVGAATGTLSCLWPDGADTDPRILISGHVGKRRGNAVRATTVAGSDVDVGAVLSIVQNDSVDAALVGPVDVDLVDQLAATSASHVRTLQPNETGVALTIKLARAASVASASVDSVSEPAIFVDPLTGAGTSMTGLIRLDQAVTMHGDSGAPAHDDNGNLVGFVEGVASGRTYLVPVGRVLDEMR